MTEEQTKEILIKFIQFINSCFDINTIISYNNYDEETNNAVIDIDVNGEIKVVNLYLPLDKEINFNYIYNTIVNYTDKKIIESYRIG